MNNDWFWQDIVRPYKFPTGVTKCADCGNCTTCCKCEKCPCCRKKFNKAWTITHNVTTNAAGN